MIDRPQRVRPRDGEGRAPLLRLRLRDHRQRPAASLSHVPGERVGELPWRPFAAADRGSASSRNPRVNERPEMSEPPPSAS
jgi:hypothetical protein